MTTETTNPTSPDRLHVDPYGKGKIAPDRSTPPSDAAIVAVASVDYEGLGHVRETYWLSPSLDGQPAYELWYSFDELPEKLSCCARLEVEIPGRAAEIAEALLEALWSGRLASAVLLAGFKEDGLVAKAKLDELYAAYVERLKPPKSKKGTRAVQGELFYGVGGPLKYRGEVRDGLAHGRGIGYWECGAVWCDGFFKNGKPHGSCRIYFRNGILRHVGTFVEGLPKGRGKEYHENGTLWFDGIFGTQSLKYYWGARIWVRGSLYHEDGTLRHKGQFVSSSSHSRPYDPAIDGPRA